MNKRLTFRTKVLRQSQCLTTVPLGQISLKLNFRGRKMRNDKNKKTQAAKAKASCELCNS